MTTPRSNDKLGLFVKPVDVSCQRGGHLIALETVTETSDDRTSLTLAWTWVSRITSVAFEMVLPALAGYWLDKKLGTVVVFLLLGVILGMTAGLYQLVKLTQPPKADSPAEKTRSDE